MTTHKGTYDDINTYLIDPVLQEILPFDELSLNPNDVLSLVQSELSLQKINYEYGYHHRSCTTWDTCIMSPIEDTTDCPSNDNPMFHDGHVSPTNQVYPLIPIYIKTYTDLHNHHESNCMLTTPGPKSDSFGTPSLSPSSIPTLYKRVKPRKIASHSIMKYERRYEWELLRSIHRHINIYPATLPMKQLVTGQKTNRKLDLSYVTMESNVSMVSTDRKHTNWSNKPETLKSLPTMYHNTSSNIVIDSDDLTHRNLMKALDSNNPWDVTDLSTSCICDNINQISNICICGVPAPFPYIKPLTPKRHNHDTSHKKMVCVSKKQSNEQCVYYAEKLKDVSISDIDDVTVHDNTMVATCYVLQSTNHQHNKHSPKSNLKTDFLVSNKKPYVFKQLCGYNRFTSLPKILINPIWNNPQPSMNVASKPKGYIYDQDKQTWIYSPTGIKQVAHFISLDQNIQYITEKLNQAKSMEHLSEHYHQINILLDSKSYFYQNGLDYEKQQPVSALATNTKPLAPHFVSSKQLVLEQPLLPYNDEPIFTSLENTCCNSYEGHCLFQFSNIHDTSENCLVDPIDSFETIVSNKNLFELFPKFLETVWLIHNDITWLINYCKFKFLSHHDILHLVNDDTIIPPKPLKSKTLLQHCKQDSLEIINLIYADNPALIECIKQDHTSWSFFSKHYERIAIAYYLHKYFPDVFCCAEYMGKSIYNRKQPVITNSRIANLILHHISELQNTSLTRSYLCIRTVLKLFIRDMDHNICNGVRDEIMVAINELPRHDL